MSWVPIPLSGFSSVAAFASLIYFFSILLSVFQNQNLTLCFAAYVYVTEPTVFSTPDGEIGNSAITAFFFKAKIKKEKVLPISNKNL